MTGFATAEVSICGHVTLAPSLCIPCRLFWSRLMLQAGKVAALSAVASSWMFSGQAQAAVELANVAASDNRLSTISLLFLPALGWVAFNMASPFFNQMNRMTELKGEAAGSSAGRRKRGLAGAVGLGAALSMAAAQQADAATELAQLAASDNRWVLVAMPCCFRVRSAVAARGSQQEVEPRCAGEVTSDALKQHTLSGFS